jgi:hypothetical protein
VVRALLVFFGLGLGLGAILSSGCSLFHRDFPTDRCESAADCFIRVENEYCNPTTHRCELTPDARILPDARPDAMPKPDASDANASDATAPGDGGDAGLNDASPSDAPVPDGNVDASQGGG